MRIVFAAGGVFATILGYYFVDLRTTLLAHPFWSPWGIILGVALAIGLAALVPRAAYWQGLTALLAALGAGVLSWNGRADFAASYADDTLAGQYWYFGYHALLFLAAFGLMRLAICWLNKPD